MNSTKEALASPLIQLFHGELYERLEKFSDSEPTSEESQRHSPTIPPRKMVKFPPGNHILFPAYVWEDELTPVV